MDWTKDKVAALKTDDLRQLRDNAAKLRNERVVAFWDEVLASRPKPSGPRSKPAPRANALDKHALLIRMNPKYWPTWKAHIPPEHESHVWFKIGRRIPEDIHPGLPVVVLGTDGMGILAVGETASAVEFRADPDWAEAAPSDQADCKEPRDRVRIRMQGLATPVPIEKVEADQTVARLPKVARETITWLGSDDYGVLMSLVRAQVPRPRYPAAVGKKTPGGIRPRR